MMFEYDVVMDNSSVGVHRMESMRMLPEFHWPADLRVDESLRADIGMLGRPSHRNRPHPDGELSDGPIREWIEAMHLHDHNRRSERLQDSRLKMERRDSFYGSSHRESVIKDRHELWPKRGEDKTRN